MYSVFNDEFAKEKVEADAINKAFYGQFNYPWPPVLFQGFTGPGLAKMLNQDVGHFGQRRVPERAKIWVAGCGTNQALITAMKYPQAEVTGTDISVESLRLCRRNADQMKVGNLTLQEKSINEVEYRAAFDYVICTGVIHHNADPQFTLAKLAEALAPDGVLELMVYNYYHRIMHVAVQKAIRGLATSKLDFSSQFEVAKKLIRNFPYQNLVSNFLSAYKYAQDAEIADGICQPIEFSYTVETLGDMMSACNLEYLLPCLNQFDKAGQGSGWNTKFVDQEIARTYDALPDVERWQLSNLLMLNESPMLWFYMQRKSSRYPRKPESQVCDEFLETKFQKSTLEIRNYRLDQHDGIYKPDPVPMAFPQPYSPADAQARLVFDHFDPRYPLKDTLHKLGIAPSCRLVNHLRNHLATTARPYLQAVE